MDYEAAAWRTRSMTSVGGLGGGLAGVDAAVVGLLSIVAFSSSSSGSVNTESGRRRVCCIGSSNWGVCSNFSGSAPVRTAMPGSGIFSAIDTCLRSGERGGDGCRDCAREVAGVRNPEVSWLEVPAAALESTCCIRKSGGSGGTGGAS